MSGPATVSIPSQVAAHPVAGLRITQNRIYTQLTILFADVASLFFCGLIAILVRHAFGGRYTPSYYLPFLGTLPVFVLMYALAGLYPGIAINPVDELRRVTYATTMAYLVVIGATFLRKSGADYSRLVFLAAWTMSLVAVVVARNAVRKFLGPLSWWGIPVVVFGAGAAGRQFVNVLRSDPSLGFRPVAVLDDDPAKQCGPGPNGEPPVLGGLSLAPRLALEYRIRYAAVAMPSVPSRQLAWILQQHAHEFPYFLLIPEYFGLASVWVTAKDIGGIFGLEVQQNLIRLVPQVVKRAFDLLLVVSGGVVILPILAVTALLVKLTSPGPVLYSQKRIGKNGREFRAWKFRSMVRNADQVLAEHLKAHPELAAEWEDRHKLTHDPRVTAFGRFMRKTSIDELPQLWNVLAGEMSLVGPRPIVQDEMVKYADAVDLYLMVRPGITGLWQVSGRSNTSYEERVSLDQYYVRNWSVWLDLFVLGRTLRTVLRAEGAC